MKTAYEIAWDLMPEYAYSCEGVKSRHNLSKITGISFKEK
jgi:hypothetical protein